MLFYSGDLFGGLAGMGGLVVMLVHADLPQQLLTALGVNAANESSQVLYDYLASGLVWASIYGLAGFALDRGMEARSRRALPVSD